MTPLTTTMTTRVELSRDLARNSAWPLFSQHEGPPAGAGQICAVTVILRGGAADTSELNERASVETASRITNLMRSLDYCAVLFLVNLTCQPRSRVVLHRGIWKAIDLPSIPTGVLRTQEVSFDCGSGMRFAAIAKVPVADLYWMVASASVFDAAIPVLLPKSIPVDSRTAEAWTKIALPPNGCREDRDFKWFRFASTIAQLRGVCVRRVNFNPSGTISIDFFGDDAMADRMMQAIVVDERAAHKGA